MADPAAAPGGVVDDSQLILAAQRGDRAAFGELYLKYSRMVHGILLARVPPPEVDDLVHDVFIQAWRRISTLRDTQAFPAWLAMIARNRANDFYRSRGQVAEMLPPHLEGGARPGQDGRYILAAIQSLPEAYRETLILRLVEQMPGVEIAARTGLTHESVRVNLHRGMKLLREKLAPLENRR